MSRSVRKKYIYKYIISKGKHFAKRRVRHFKGDILNGCFYKKLYNSWNVIDDVDKQLQTEEKLKCFKYYVTELKRNWKDRHLTIEQASFYLEELETLGWYYKVKFK